MVLGGFDQRFSGGLICGYPLDGSYAYHCGWDPREYDIYNGVTQDLWYRSMVVAKA